ncbi:MAG: hypothetical protein ACI97N_000915 [Cognaticolwellia sp.]|jgi:hypothetical protein
MFLIVEFKQNVLLWFDSIVYTEIEWYFKNVFQFRLVNTAKSFHFCTKIIESNFESDKLHIQNLFLYQYPKSLPREMLLKSLLLETIFYPKSHK